MSTEQHTLTTGDPLLQTAPAALPGTPVPVTVVKPSRDRTMALLLAVPGGWLTWLYTYKVDAWKFWLSLCLIPLTFGMWLFVAMLWAIVETLNRDEDFYTYYPDRRPPSA